MSHNERTTSRLVEDLDLGLNHGSLSFRADLCYEKGKALLEVGDALRTNGEYRTAVQTFDTAASLFERSAALYGKVKLGGARSQAIDMAHAANGRSERTAKRAAIAGLNWNGLFAAQGRQGYWFVSWGNDGNGNQAPCDADDEFLLSTVSQEHANDVLLARWLAGEID